MLDYMHPFPVLKFLALQLSLEPLHPATDANQITWSIGDSDLDTQCWDTRSNFVVVGTSGVGKTTVLATLVQAIAAQDPAEARIVLIDERRSHLGTVDEAMIAAYAATSAATEKALRD